MVDKVFAVPPKGFHFSSNDDPDTFFRAFFYAGAKVVVGNNLRSGVVRGQRCYISSYRMGYSMSGVYFEVETFWVNPNTGSQIFEGISRDDQPWAYSKFDPRLATTVQLNPLTFVRNIAFRLQLMFIQGKKIICLN